MKIFTALILASFSITSRGDISELPNKRYCSHIDYSTGEGVEGWFAMEIDQSTSSAKYRFNLDFTDYVGSCDVSQGIKFHIHSSWDSPNGASTTKCGKSHTGGHYDPNLACGPASAHASDACVLLDRTENSGYAYSCSKTQYTEGNFTACELGDLSGKFGYAHTDNLIFTSGIIKDPLGPFVTDYNSKWLSIVWHCMASNMDRFLCAKLETDNDPSYESTCLENHGYDESADSENDSALELNYTREQLVEGIIISVVLSIILTLACYAASVFCINKDKKESTKTTVARQGDQNNRTVQSYAPEVQPRTLPPSNPMHRI